MSLFRNKAEQNRELINNLYKKVQRLEKEKQRYAGDVFAGGVTLNEQLMERNQPLALTSPEASGTAIPVMPSDFRIWSITTFKSRANISCV